MALPALLANYVHYGNGSSTGYYAVTAWATGAAKSVGNLVRQLAAPATGSERVFVCVVAGTTHATTEPTWTVTRGAKTTDNTVTWQEATGVPALNGDLTNTIRWSVVKNTSVSLGVVIKDASNNVFICTTAGTAGNGAEPTWATTVGNTTADNTVTWTCVANAAFGAWAAPHARLANAFAVNWGAAGDDFYLASASAETQASTMTLTSPGTAASPCRVLCVNAAGSVPPAAADLTTGATVSTTGAVAINCNGFAYVYGVTLSGGSGVSGFGGILTFVATANPCYWKMESCALTTPNTGSTTTFVVGVASGGGEKDQLLELVNTTMSFGHAGQTITVRCPLRWRNTASAIGGTAPTTLFTLAGGTASDIDVQGVDLSALGSGKSLVTFTTSWGSCKFTDCKLGSSVAFTAGSISGQGGANLRAVNCDSADTNYRYQRQTYQGTITQETTIVRSGGATDGTTPVSRKMVSTANAKFYAPLESDWVVLWDNSPGPKTATFATVTDNVTLTDADAWVEVEYLGTSGFPLGNFAQDRSTNVLTTPANQTTDGTSSWTTTGLGTPVKQSLSTTFTTTKAGPIRARVCLAKASATVYFDPKVTVS